MFNKNPQLGQKKTILDEISTNIQKNSLNLNNPEMFYSSIFAQFLREEKEKDEYTTLNKKMNDILPMKLVNYQNLLS